MGERKVLTSRRREKTTMKNKHEGVTRLVQENLFLLRYYLNTSVTELLLGPNNRVTPSLFFIFLSFPGLRLVISYRWAFLFLRREERRRKTASPIRNKRKRKEKGSFIIYLRWALPWSRNYKRVFNFKYPMKSYPNVK